MSYLNRINSAPLRDVSDASIPMINTLTSQEDFQADIAADSAQASKFICEWCIRVNQYLEKLIILRPTLTKLDEVEAEYETSKRRLAALQRELDDMNEQLQESMEKMTLLTMEYEGVKGDLDRTSQRSRRTKQITQHLSVHFAIWEQKLKKLTDKAGVIDGNSILSAACIEYLGPLEEDMRKRLKHQWQKVLSSKNIKYSQGFDLSKFLGTRFEIYKWRLAGLPESSLNFENALILQYNKKRKLVYDPNDTCLMWLSRMSVKGDLKLQASSLNDAKLVSSLQTCLERGETLMLDFYTGEPNGVVSSLLRPEVRDAEGQKTVRVEDMWYAYDSNFDLILLTRNEKVVAIPELKTVCCVTKFILDGQGLQEAIKSQLSQIFDPESEQVQLETLKAQLEKKAYVEDSQAKILRRLVLNSDDAVIDDDEYLTMLQKYAELSAEIEKANKTAGEEADDSKTAVNNLLALMVDIYKMCERFSAWSPSLLMSANGYMKVVDRCVRISGAKSGADFTKELTLSVVRNVFNIMSGGVNSEVRLFMLVDLCVTILKQYHHFRQDLWNYIISPGSSKRNSVSELSIDLGGSVWQKLQILRTMVPAIEMEHLPVLMHIFRQISAIGIEAAIQEATSKTEALSSLERLAMYVSFMPENFNLCLEVFAEDVLPGSSKQAGSHLDDLLAKAACDQPTILMVDNSCDYDELAASLNKSMKTKPSVIFSGNISWEKLKPILDKAAINGHVIILSEFNLNKELHYPITRYLRELNGKSRLNKAFRLVLTIPATSTDVPVELMSISLKLTQHVESSSTGIEQFVKQIDVESHIRAGVVLQNISLNAALAYYILYSRSFLGNDAFLQPLSFADSDLDTLFALLNSTAKLELKQIKPEVQMLKVKLFYIIFGLSINEVDKATMDHFWQQAFEIETKNVIRLRPLEIGKEWQAKFPEVFREVLLEIVADPEIKGDKYTGVSSQAIDEAQKAKAEFFSNNVINLERKAYADIFKVEAQATTKVDFPSILSNLMSSLPNDLKLRSQKDLEEECKYSYLKRFLLSEVMRYNESIEKIREDIEVLGKFIAKDYRPTPGLKAMVDYLSVDKVPQSWIALSGMNVPKLTDWITRLNKRFEFLNNVVENNFLKIIMFDARILTDTAALLDSYLLDCAYQRSPTMVFNDITMNFKLTSVFEKNAGSLPNVNL
jgi:hypothetical protein